MLTIWIVVGILYGMFFNSWGWTAALYYAVGAISTAGVFPPTCGPGSDDYDCELTPWQVYNKYTSFDEFI